MDILALIIAAAAGVGAILVIRILIRCMRRSGRVGAFVYPISRSSKGIPEARAKMRTPPGPKR